MALFKSRKGGDDPVAVAAQSESVEAARRRARHRLVGAALLVLAGVVGFPLLFDTQPRPIAVDIPIEIPDKNKARPVVIAAAPPSAATAAAAASTADTPPVKSTPGTSPKMPEKSPKTADSALKPSEQKSTDVTPKVSDKPAVPASKPVIEAAVKSASKTASSESKPAAASPDAAKAQALLDGSSSDKPVPAENRFVVQVGAFSDATLAKEARAKLERAGLKTYTTVVETKDGQRTRVRVGPFADKTAADTAADKIKALDLPAAILAL